MPNLQTSIIDTRFSYKKYKHYEYFYSEKTVGHAHDGIQKLYLTYYGVLKVLFTSRNKSVDKFAEWASETLFTVQMGTNTQKICNIANFAILPSKNIKFYYVI